MTALTGIGLLGVTLLPPKQAVAQTKFWDNGGGNGLWATAANWNPDGLPGAADDAANATGLGITLQSLTTTINSFATNGLLTIGSSGNLTINTTLTFNPGGSLQMSGGTLAEADISDPSLINFSTSSSNIFSNVTLLGTTLNVANSNNTSTGYLRIIMVPEF